MLSDSGRLITVNNADLGNADTSYTYFDMAAGEFRHMSFDYDFANTTLTLEASNSDYSLADTSKRWKDCTTAVLGIASLTSTYTNLGDATTQFDITLGNDHTVRYTYDTTGTAPVFVTSGVEVGDVVVIASANMNAVNRGAFRVITVAETYIEVTNALGIAESNKTLGAADAMKKSRHDRYTITDNIPFQRMRFKRLTTAAANALYLDMTRSK